MRRFHSSLLLPLLLLVACATPPLDAISRAPPGDPSLSDVRTRVDASIGKRVRWGGTIITTENGPHETRIAIVERRLDDYGRPIATAEGLGRFMARVQGFLDPAVYERGREITVAGAVDGSVTQPVGDYQYDYVLIRADTVKLWEPHVARRYYSPDPFYDPFWPGWYPWYRPYPFYPY